MAVVDRTHQISFPPLGISSDTNDPSHVAQNLTDTLKIPLLAHELIERGFYQVQRYFWELLSKTVSEKYAQIAKDKDIR